MQYHQFGASWVYHVYIIIHIYIYNYIYIYYIIYNNYIIYIVVGPMYIVRIYIYIYRNLPQMYTVHTFKIFQSIVMGPHIPT